MRYFRYWLSCCLLWFGLALAAMAAPAPCQIVLGGIDGLLQQGQPLQADADHELSPNARVDAWAVLEVQPRLQRAEPRAALPWQVSHITPLPPALALALGRPLAPAIRNNSSLSRIGTVVLLH